jgi:DNA-binding response OmpR family regulator/class 3 adenylate cyclase/predicted ATPase
MRSRILIVSRDAGSCAKLARLLRAAGYMIEIAEDAAHVSRLPIKSVALAIVVPDTPGADIRALVGDIESATGGPVLVARSGPPSRLAAPSVDLADASAVLSQVRHCLQAVNAVEDSPQTLNFAGYRLDVAGHSLIGDAGHEIPLTRNELRLLRVFLQRPGRVLSREYLLQALSGREAESFDRSVDMLVVRLRRKIEPDPKHPNLIVTVPGSGYKFDSEVRTEEAISAPVASAAEASAAGERRQVTALSAELVPAFDGQFPADSLEIKPLLKAHQARAAAIITGYGGLLAQDAGRDVLAYFGQPIAQEDAGERAIKAGLAIANQADDGATLTFRVGIATGTVIAGPAHEIVGSAPVQAARMRSLAKPGRVVIDTPTRRLGNRLFSYEVLRSAGDEPVSRDAWRVLGPSALSSRSATLYESRTTSLIGRLDERDQLLRAWEHARAGKGQIILLSGEPGIGKSRLVAELEEWVAPDPHLYLGYFCSALHQGSPLYPIIARWGQEIGFAHDDGPEERLDKLEAFFAPQNLPTQDMALLAAMLGAEPARRYPQSELSPTEYKAQTFALLTRMFVDLARRRPMLVVVEDVHWADNSSLEFLDALIDHVSDLPILLVISFRPDFVPPWSDHPGIRSMTLTRLGRREAAALVTEVTSRRGLAEGEMERIVVQADGIPLFLEELAKAVLDIGNVDPIAALPVPCTLQASLMARLDRLPAGKRVAQIGAIIGREFPHELLKAVAGMPADRLTKGIGELVASGLVSRRGLATEARYAFKHALVQETAYDSLLISARRDIHRRIAEVMFDRHQNRANAEPEIVAYHLERADLPALAMDWFIKAGELALRRPAYAEAITHLETALRLADALDDNPDKRRSCLRLQIVYGNALRLARGFGLPETQAAFAVARDLSTAMGNVSERFAAYYGLWSASFQRGELSSMREIAAAFLLDAESAPNRPEAAVAHRICGSTHWFEGNFIAAQKHLERALSIYEAAPDQDLAHDFGQDVAASAMANLALTLGPMGFLERADALARQAVGHALTTQHVPTMAYANGHAVIFEMMRLERNGSTPHAQALLGLARRHGMALWLATGLLHEAWSRWDIVEHEVGLAKMREGLAIMHTHQQEAFMPLPIMLLAEMEAEAGGVDAAVSAIDTQIRKIERTGQRWFLSELQRARGDILYRQQPNCAAAEAAYACAIETARGQAAKLFELHSAIRLGRVWIGQGKRIEAHDLLTPLCVWFGDTSGDSALREAWALLH